MGSLDHKKYPRYLILDCFYALSSIRLDSVYYFSIIDFNIYKVAWGSII